MDLPRDDEILIADSNPVFGLEARGFEHIPEAERNMKLGQIAPLWLGVNLNMVNISLGCLAVAGGLAPWLAFTACLVGNLPFLLLGPASIGAVRLGLPVTTLSRAAYGLQGNFVHAGLMWAASICFEALNTVIGVLAWLALMGMMGLDAHGAGTKILAVAVQLVVGGGVAVLGHDDLFPAHFLGGAGRHLAGCSGGHPWSDGPSGASFHSRTPGAPRRRRRLHDRLRRHSQPADQLPL